MSDEIRNDDDMHISSSGGEERSIRGVCPNMTHLPMEQKEEVVKKVTREASDMLMKMCISLGISGEIVVGMEDAASGSKFELKFKASPPIK